MTATVPPPMCSENRTSISTTTARAMVRTGWWKVRYARARSAARPEPRSRSVRTTSSCCPEAAPICRCCRRPAARPTAIAAAIRRCRPAAVAHGRNLRRSLESANAGRHHVVATLSTGMHGDDTSPAPAAWPCSIAPPRSSDGVTYAGMQFNFDVTPTTPAPTTGLTSGTLYITVTTPEAAGYDLQHSRRSVSLIRRSRGA